jgi:hypothetical protein
VMSVCFFQRFVVLWVVCVSLLRPAFGVDERRVASGAMFCCGCLPPSNDGTVSFVCVRQRLKKSSCVSCGRRITIGGCMSRYCGLGSVLRTHVCGLCIWEHALSMAWHTRFVILSVHCAGGEQNNIACPGRHPTGNIVFVVYVQSPWALI